MAFTQFSQPIARPDMYKPLSDELILAGAKANYEHGEQAAKKIGATYNSLFGISTYGKDSEVLSQMQQEFQQQVGELSKQGLSSPEANAKINQLITQYSSSKDVLGIHQRKAAYDSELEAKKEAESKNQQYISPIIEQAEKYYSGDKYYSDTKFNQSGWVDPNIEKMKREGLKDLQKVKKTTLKNGVYVTTEEYDPEQLSSLYQGIYSSPLVQKTMNHSFDNKYKDVDFATEGVKKAQSTLDQAELQKNNSFSVMQKEPANSSKYLQAQQDYLEADNFINKYSNLVKNPGKLGENLKAQMKQDEINKLIQDDIDGDQFTSEVEVKESGFALNNQKFEQEKQFEQFKQLLSGTETYNLTPKEVDHLIKTGSVNKDGTVVTLSDVSKASVDYQANAAYQKSLGAAQAKAKVKSDTLGILGDTRIPGTQSITIGNTNYTKAQWDDITERAKNPETAKWTDADRTALVDVIKTYPEYFGLPDDYSSLAGTDVKIKPNGDIQIVNPWYSRNTPAADLSRFATAVNDAALNKKPNVDPNNPLLKGDVDKNNPLLKP